jgi:ankyrin repeat protein
MPMLSLTPDDPLAVAVTSAIRSGDIDALSCLLSANPGLATVRIGTRTLLHVVADWPGHFPNGAAVVNTLIAAGADPNARHTGRGAPETPLHWAASSDDVQVLDALIDGGADIEAPEGSIGGGTPLDDAVGYGQWQAARRLVARGARVYRLWHAAALGMQSLVQEHFAAPPTPTPDDISVAFWQACHGGQREAAEYLLRRGADLNWVPPWAKGRPLDIAERSGNTDLLEWLRSQGAKSADSAKS